MQNHNALKWSDISLYREELFGLVIISIVIFHYFEGVAGADYVGTTLKKVAMVFNGAIGSVGVDIFVLLSGLGHQLFTFQEAIHKEVFL